MAHIRSLFFKGPLSEIGEKTLAAYKTGKLSEVIWNITNGCNLLCKHCYVNATHKKKERELDDGEALQLVDRIAEAGVPLLFITGGEPFLRRSLYDVLERAYQHGVRTVMSTNGTLINDAAADKLVEFGVDYVAISLYGPEDFHDEYVKVPGTFRRIVANIRRLQDRGVKVGIKTTVNAETYPFFYDTVEVAKGLGASLLYPCDLIATGRAVNLYDRRITTEQWRGIADFMLDDVLKNESGMEYDIGAQPSIAAYITERLRSLGYDVDPAIDRLRVKSSCPVGKGLLTINSEGNILPCSFMQDYHIGNIRKLSLAKAASILEDIGRTEVDGRCGSCKFGALCRGCRAKAFFASRNIQSEDPLCMLA
ncbi:MAG: radical SAM protein [Candidatus Aquicultorales bacterium]